MASEWEKGQLTTSGYSYIIKSAKGGQALAETHELFRGDARGVGADSIVLRNVHGAGDDAQAREDPEMAKSGIN